MPRAVPEKAPPNSPVQQVGLRRVRAWRCLAPALLGHRLQLDRPLPAGQIGQAPQLDSPLPHCLSRCSPQRRKYCLPWQVSNRRPLSSKLTMVNPLNSSLSKDSLLKASRDPRYPRRHRHNLKAMMLPELSAPSILRCPLVTRHRHQRRQHMQCYQQHQPFSRGRGPCLPRHPSSHPNQRLSPSPGCPHLHPPPPLLAVAAPSSALPPMRCDASCSLLQCCVVPVFTCPSCHIKHSVCEPVVVCTAARQSGGNVLCFA